MLNVTFKLIFDKNFHLKLILSIIEYIHYHYGKFFSLLRCSNFIPGSFVSDSQPNKKKMQ